MSTAEHETLAHKTINTGVDAHLDPFAMTGLSHIVKIREYCDYLEKHLISVQQAWYTLEAACNDMQFIRDDLYRVAIRRMIIAHDLSKFSAEEFIAYQHKFFPAYLQLSDVPASTDEFEFAEAWGHHKTNNLHHWQSWQNTSESFPGEHVCHCVCMIVDWMAMSSDSTGSSSTAPRTYYERYKDEIKLPVWAVSLMYGIFDRLDKLEQRRELSEPDIELGLRNREPLPAEYDRYSSGAGKSSGVDDTKEEKING